MTSRLLSLLVWALVAASTVAWGLKLTVRPAAVPPSAVTAQNAPPAAGPVERLLGRAPPPPVEAEPEQALADDRFMLLGVVAGRPGQPGGWALISVDAGQARAVALGSEVEPGLRVLSVTHRRVELGAKAGAATVTLELPPLAEALRGQPDAVPLAVVSTRPVAVAPSPGARQAHAATSSAAPTAAPTPPTSLATSAAGGLPRPVPGAGLPMLAASAVPTFTSPHGMPPSRSTMPPLATLQAAQQAALQAAQQAARQGMPQTATPIEPLSVAPDNDTDAAPGTGATAQPVDRTRRSSPLSR